MKRTFPESELIINADGSCFHLHLKPEQLADKVVLVGDPARVDTVAAHFDSKECEVSSREFHTITGMYKGKRITCQSHGIGCDNIDIVVNELDTLANIDYKTREACSTTMPDAIRSVTYNSKKPSPSTWRGIPSRVHPTCLWLMPTLSIR